MGRGVGVLCAAVSWKHPELVSVALRFTQANVLSLFYKSSASVISCCQEKNKHSDSHLKSYKGKPETHRSCLYGGNPRPGISSFLPFFQGQGFQGVFPVHSGPCGGKG